MNAATSLRSALNLSLVSLRRLLRPTQTIICAVCLMLAVAVSVIFTVARNIDVPQSLLDNMAYRLPEADLNGDYEVTQVERRQYLAGRASLDFTKINVLLLYVSFLLPIFCVCYATSSIATEREDGTLIYAFISPIPRPMIFIAKFVSALVVVMAWTIGGFALVSIIGGNGGWAAFTRCWPAVALTTVAYVSLFHIFSVVFRRATIVSLLYALFFEGMLGSVPGTMKRVAVSFYTRCMILDAGADIGLVERNVWIIPQPLPVTGQIASIVLALAAASLFAVGLLLFARREYV